MAQPPDSRRAKMTHKHRKKLMISFFLGPGCLDVIFWGLKASPVIWTCKLQFLVKKRKTNFCCIFYVSFWSSWIGSGDSLEMLDMDPYWIQIQWIRIRSSALNQIAPSTGSLVTALPGSRRGYATPGRGRWASWRARTACSTRRKGTLSAAAAPLLPAPQKGII